MQVKKNVDIFNQDVLTGQGYKYTDENRLSSRLANERMTLAIKAVTDWQGKTVIDLGCGDGSYTKLIAQFGAASVLGVDPAEVAIAKAQEKYVAVANLKFSIGNIYQLDDLQQTFDIAVLRGVLHHLPDAARAVAKAASIAKEVVILEPNGANPLLKVIERLSSYHRDHEEQSFLPSTIRGWCTDAGLIIRQEQFVNLVPFFCPTLLAKVLRAIEPFVEALPLVRVIACGQIILKADYA